MDVLRLMGFRDAPVRSLPATLSMLFLALLPCACGILDPDGVAPEVRIVQPADQSVVEVGDLVEIVVEASDEDGTLRHVEFRIDGQVVARDETSPFAWTWDTTDEPKLRHMITVVAEDDSGIQSRDSVAIQVRWAYAPPESIDDDWEISSLTDVDIEPAPLEELINTLRDNDDHLVHSILIVRHNKLVFEKYFSGRSHPTWLEAPTVFDRETQHVLSSVAKSFAATLLGIAIDKGFIDSVDEKVFDFFPHLSDLAVGAKQNLTLDHLVNMTAGLEWDESSATLGQAGNDLTDLISVALNTDNDLVRFILGMPTVWEPGSEFHYSGGNTNVLGNAIQVATGQRLDHFADEYLFEPMGIDDAWWWVLRDDFVYCSGDIALRPREMAMVGQMYLQGGVWEGQQIVPADWVETSATSRFTFPPTSWWTQGLGFDGYGYGWWQNIDEYGEGAFSASGWGGQEIMVLPELDMVVIFTGGSYWEDPLRTPHQMMSQVVLSAVGNTP